MIGGLISFIVWMMVVGILYLLALTASLYGPWQH